MKKFLPFILFFLISNSFVNNSHAAFLENGDSINSTSSYFVFNHDINDEENKPHGMTFNNDGTKMYVVGEGEGSDNEADDIHEYTLSKPYDPSTRTFRVGIPIGHPNSNLVRQIQFSNDGSKMFISTRGNANKCAAPCVHTRIWQYSLSTNFDISTATYSNIFFSVANEVTKIFGSFEFNNDGTMMYATDAAFNGASTEKVYQYSLSIPFDLSGTVTLVRSKALQSAREFDLGNFIPDREPLGIEFNEDGTRLFLVGKYRNDISQYTLSEGFNIDTASLDGGLQLGLAPSGVEFSPSGLKMFVVNDVDDYIREYKLPCPFNFFAGGCPSITSDSDRLGMAEAQIESAKRAMNLSTNSALNRLKWIRRNKDKQKLNNQNAKLNFSGTTLSTLSPLPISSFKKISNHKTNKEADKNYFHWSEGDISLGRIGKNKNASRKENLTNAITYGVDKFKEDNGVEGFAFRYGIDDIDIGDFESNLDSRTYNITYYNTSPMKDDTKYIDKIFGIGRINSDIRIDQVASSLTADRTGHQIYGTLKIKDEYKKNNLIFIPSGQIDLGHTKLDGYRETGDGGIRVEDQHISTQNLRAALALVDDLSTNKYTYRKHGKLEYLADIDRTSSFQYTYNIDSTSLHNDNLETGALHNLNFEVGIDIIFPERFSLFAIYERNQTLDNNYSAHTDNLYLALGYLPNKDTEYTFSLNGSENLVSNFEIKKNINGYNISFNLAENLMNLGEATDASINVNKVF